MLGKNNRPSEGELCVSCKNNCEGQKQSDIIVDEDTAKQVVPNAARGKSGSWQALGSSEMGMPGERWADLA